MVPKLDEKSLNVRTAPFTRSNFSKPSKPDRLFKSDEHEDEPPVATASSMSKMPSFIEASEAPISTSHGAGIRYRGTEYLTNLTTSASVTGRGQVLYAIPISPQTIPDTRLQLAAQQYTRFIFRKIKFYYSGTAPTTTAGSLMMFGDYDPSQNPSASPGDAALRYAFTHNCAEFSVWQQASCEINDRVYEDMLYCDPDEELRWSVQGCFWLLTSGAVPASTELGKLVLEYEIDFAVPDYRGTITSGSITSTSLAVAIGNAGTTVVATPTAVPPRGAYLMRIDAVTAGDIDFNVSLNAYQQGAPTIRMAAGQCFFVTLTTAGTGINMLWTPDVYSLLGASNSSIVLSSTITGSSRTYAVTFFPIEAVSND